MRTRARELQKIKSADLETKAAAAYNEYLTMRGIDSHALLIETEAYPSELRHREERRRHRVELILEFVIIALIGFEIYEGRTRRRP